MVARGSGAAPGARAGGAQRRGSARSAQPCARAATARAEGTLVSFKVAPPTRTRSVVKNRALAAAYAGLGNEALAAEVEDLKSGEAAIEERARSELGMVKPGEIYVHVTPARR